MLSADVEVWFTNLKYFFLVTVNQGRGRGRGQHLSERVRRSLNPTLFRNIEYDVWHKTKRGDSQT